MATNKNKNAAALFELLDKSTLKVPKSGGSLKIPSWWSSKTNPAAAPAAKPATPAPMATPATQPEASAATATVAAPASRPMGKSISASAAKEAPSIRPPGKPATAAAPATVPLTVTVSAAPAARAAPRVFAPQTMSQSNEPREGPTHSAPPKWLIMAGAGALLLVILVGAWIIFRGGKTAKVTSPQPVDQAQTQTPGQGQIVQPPDGGAQGRTHPPVNQQQPPAQQPQPPIQQPQPPQQQQPPAAGPGRVVPYDDVKRVAGTNYLMIFTAADEKTATANAQYLAASGVSTSVKASGRFFQVISVEGFTKLDETSTVFQTKVMKLGREANHKGAYDTSYFQKLVR